MLKMSSFTVLVREPHGNLDDAEQACLFYLELGKKLEVLIV